MSEKDTGVHCPSKTCWDRPTRTHQARYWEFRQYDLKLFDPANLEHKHLEYYCYQFQELDGHKHAHGMLRFGVKQKYACVHKLIGAGEYCDIRVAYRPEVIRINCQDNNCEHDAVEHGSLFKLPIRKTKRSKKSKKHVVATTANVDTTFAQYLAKIGMVNTIEDSRSQLHQQSLRRKRNREVYDESRVHPSQKMFKPVKQ